MNVKVYLEKQADMGETCVLLQQLGVTNIETIPSEYAINGQIDARQVDQVMKVKGVSHMLKGPYVAPPFLPAGEEYMAVVNSVLNKPQRPAYKTWPTVTRVGPEPPEEIVVEEIKPEPKPKKKATKPRKKK
jgi:hypothetical protein